MRFRKKPVEVDAYKFTGNNFEECCNFCGPNVQTVINKSRRTVTILTLEGQMTASAGDWIIRGVKGDCYPCKPGIFDATYEEVKP